MGSNNDNIYCSLAVLAYEEPEYVTQMAPMFGYAVLEYLDVGPAEGYLFVGPHDAVMAFRGTEASEGKLWDIMSNVRFVARRWEGPGKVHLGYGRMWRRLRSRAFDMLDTVPASKPLIITGHSLGGATATVCAADMFHKGWQASRLVTFGAPKCVNKEAAAAIKCPIKRYVNDADWAPSWPPSFTLRHPSRKIDIMSPRGGHAPTEYVLAMEKYCNA
jgi:predicted lipase